MLHLYELQLLTEFAFSSRSHSLHLEFYEMRLNNKIPFSLNKMSEYGDRSSFRDYDLLINFILSMQINNKYVFKVKIPDKIKYEKNNERQEKLLNYFLYKKRDIGITLNISRREIKSYLKKLL